MGIDNLPRENYLSEAVDEWNYMIGNLEWLQNNDFAKNDTTSKYHKAKKLLIEVIQIKDDMDCKNNEMTEVRKKYQLY